ncbi:hypothetical protein [Streptomyces sp. NPDC046985]|uniref:hypothetical protein n=1 Tax=Streptomyces sp. NPDC046985 TaxID=3155377 RepID=UPI0033ECB173
MRAALEAGGDVPAEAEGPDFRSMVHVAAAICLGAQEVGADALAEGPPVDWGLLQQNADMVAQVLRASDAELMRAREVLVGLRMFYGLYVLHGLLLPDTPAQAALRQRIDEWGMFPFLDQVIAINPSPRQFAENPDTFSIPGDETGAVGFEERWMRSMEEPTKGWRGVGEDADDGPGGSV